MLSLKKYIINSNSYISSCKELKEHFELEFKLRQMLEYSYTQVNEKHGVYDGQIEFVVTIVKEIINCIDNKELFDNFEVSKADLEDAGYKGNIFFNKICVSYKSGETGYYDNKSKIDSKTNLFDNVYINIGRDEYTSYTDICMALVHELTHAWEDYNRKLSGKETLNDIANKKKYKNLVVSGNKINYVNIAKRIEYQLTQFETNAYLSELNVLLKTNSKKIQTYNDALELFEQTDIWNTYETLYSLVCMLDEERFEILTNTYNKINDTNFTANKLRKKLKNRFERVLRRINKNVPKIYYDYYTEQQYNEGLLNRRGPGIISLISDMKNYQTPAYIKRSKC